MSDNINHIGSAPAVQYVILSSCLVRIITLMFAIVVMIYLLLIQIKSHTKLLIYSTIQFKNLIIGNLLRVVLLRF